MDEQQEQQYIKGFNSGYLLAKHEPELATQLTAMPNDRNAYFKGLTSGKQEYDKEVQEWAKSFSKNAPTKEGKENKGHER